MSIHITISSDSNNRENHRRHQSTAAIVTQHVKSLFDTHFKRFRRSCANELEGEQLTPACMINILLSIIGDQITFDKNQQLCYKHQLLDSVVLFRRICHSIESESSVFISELAQLYERGVPVRTISRTMTNFIQAEIDRLSIDCLSQDNSVSGLLPQKRSSYDGNLPPEVQEYWDTLLNIQSTQNLHRQYCYLLFLLEVFEWPTLQRISSEFASFIQDGMEKEYQLNLTVKLGICLVSGNPSSYDVGELSKYIDLLKSQRSESVCDKNLLTVFYNMRGCAELYREGYSEALRDFEEALKVDSKFAHAWNNKGKCLLGMKKLEESKQCYSRAIELDSTLSFAYSNRAAVLREQNMFQEAIKDYTTAIELDTNNATVYFNRGVLHVELGKFEEAIVDLSKAIEIRPYFSEAIQKRADVLMKAGRFEEAASDYTRCIEMETDDLTLYNLRGMCYSMLERHEEAFQDYSKVMDLIEINDSTLLLHRGRTVVVMGLHFLGLQDLTTVIEDVTVDDAKRAQAFLARARSYDSLSRFSEASSDYEQSLKLDGSNPEFYLFRGMHHALQGKAFKALQDYSACLEMDQKNWKAYLNRSKVYESKRQYDHALDDAKKGYELTSGRNIMLKARYLRLKEFKEFRQRYKQQQAI